MKKETREEFRQLIEERIKNRERVGFFNSIKPPLCDWRTISSALPNRVDLGSVQ